jgi:hypothetical protein
VRSSLAAAALVGGLVVAGVGADHAAAMIIAGDPATSNTPAAHLAAPANDPGWANVGWFSFSATGAPTAVYLGNGWAIGADHSFGSTIRLGADGPSGGTAYTVTSSIQLHQPGDPGTLTDLRLFQLASDPGLPTLNIAAQSPSVGSSTVLIGTGLVRGSQQQSYNLGAGGIVQGYDWGETRHKAWGTSAVSEATTPRTLNNRPVFAFGMDFLNQSGAASAADKDSGSAVFVFNASLSQWELAGINVAVGNVLSDGNGLRASQFGNNQTPATITYAVDLSLYRDQIFAITLIPEPGSVAWLAAGGLLVMLRRRAWQR